MGGGAAAEPSSAAATKRKRKSTVLYSPPEQLSSGRGGGWKGGGGGGAWLRRTLAEYEEVFRRHDKEAALEDEEYEVESVLASEVRGGVLHYRVKWVGYPLSDATWERAEHCQGCEELIHEFEQSSRKAKSQPPKQAAKHPRKQPGQGQQPEGALAAVSQPTANGREAKQRQPGPAAEGGGLIA